MRGLVDLTGHRFGRLLVLRHAFKDARSAHHWRCVCSCGREVVILGSSLTAKHQTPTRSCGCLQRELACGAHIKHGMRYTPEYRAWAAIRNRCLTHRYYGARGIRVCERWSSFENFFSDMGRRPDGMTSIDRIDVNGDYCHENCRWANSKIQGRNKRTTRYVTLNGEKMCLADAAEKAGIASDAIIKRLNAGWDEHRALTTPTRQRNARQPNVAV